MRFINFYFSVQYSNVSILFAVAIKKCLFPRVQLSVFALFFWSRKIRLSTGFRSCEETFEVRVLCRVVNDFPLWIAL